MPSPKTVREAYAEMASRLASAGVASAEVEAWQLLEAGTGRSRGELISGEGPLTGGQQRRLGEWLARRELREPLQLILGRAYFYGLEIPVEAGVLIPRPETERLVEITLEALRVVPEPRILDVGTGSGAVALALKNERPDAVVAACDVDEVALEATRRTAAALELEVALYRSDLLANPAVERFARHANAIVSNPPYLPESDRTSAQPEVRWEPASALYAGEDGLAVFGPLARQALPLLSPGALLVVELDPRNVELARSEAGGWSGAEIHADLVGRKRFLLLRR